MSDQREPDMAERRDDSIARSIEWHGDHVIDTTRSRIFAHEPAGQSGQFQRTGDEVVASGTTIAAASRHVGCGDRKAKCAAASAGIVETIADHQHGVRPAFFNSSRCATLCRRDGAAAQISTPGAPRDRLGRRRRVARHDLDR